MRDHKERLLEMVGHTPGPWVARQDPHGIPWGGDDYCIGRENGKIDEVAVCGKRDARLIAAAPELLDALKLARNYVSREEDLARVDAALAKVGADES